MNKKAPKIAFFGTPDRAVYALDEMKAAGMLPSLIITQPDRAQGRKMIVTAPPAKVWAQANNIPVLQPEKLNDEAFIKELQENNFDVFVVVAYGKIMPQNILDIAKHGSINLHGSLLPKLRGSSPIETAILDDEKKTGVTIIKMDSLMDHGPILGQKVVEIPQWPIPADDLAKILVEAGGKMLVEIIPRLIDGTAKPIEQDHSQATATKKIAKEDGLISLSDDPYKNFLKFNAYKGWPGIFYFIEKDGKKIRINITEASFTDGKLVIEKIVPEGKKEIAYKDFK